MNLYSSYGSRERPTALGTAAVGREWRGVERSVGRGARSFRKDERSEP